MALGEAGFVVVAKEQLLAKGQELVKQLEAEGFVLVPKDESERNDALAGAVGVILARVCGIPFEIPQEQVIEMLQQLGIDAKLGERRPTIHRV